MRLHGLAAIGVALTLAATGCGSDDDGDQTPILVVAAFPAELAALLEHTAVDETLVIDGRRWRVGNISGVPVIVGMTGIGLINAESSTRAVLDRTAVRAIVFSGVAGSPRRIGDVVVPEEWVLPGGQPDRVDAALLQIARDIAADDGLEFERCTVLPAEPESEPVCLEHRPGLFVGGRGESDDPFGGTALPCQPDGDDVFGCDVTATAAASGMTSSTHGDEAAAVDMESAAVAREAALRGIPFIAFRGVSDGSGDPLDLPGFPAQFFAYYRLAARNAAIAAAALVEELGGR